MRDLCAPPRLLARKNLNELTCVRHTLSAANRHEALHLVQSFRPEMRLRRTGPAPDEPARGQRLT